MYLRVYAHLHFYDGRKFYAGCHAGHTQTPDSGNTDEEVDEYDYSDYDYSSTTVYLSIFYNTIHRQYYLNSTDWTVCSRRMWRALLVGVAVNDRLSSLKRSTRYCGGISEIVFTITYRRYGTGLVWLTSLFWKRCGSSTLERSNARKAKMKLIYRISGNE